MPAGAVIGVGHVKFGFIRRETEAVGAGIAARASKVVGHDRRARGIAIGGIELIDIIAGRIPGRPFGNAAVVVGIGEPDGAVGFHRHVVRRVKLQSIAVGHQRSHHAVGDHGNLLPGASGFRADQPFLRVEHGAVEQRVRGREEEIGDGGGRDEFFEPVVVLVAEHQEAAATLEGTQVGPSSQVLIVALVVRTAFVSMIRPNSAWSAISNVTVRARYEDPGKSTREWRPIPFRLFSKSRLIEGRELALCEKIVPIPLHQRRQ